MPVLKNGIQFVGTFADVTAYCRPGSDKIYIRTKGGHSKERMLRDSSFDLPMKNASEFCGCGKAAGMFRKALSMVADLHEPGLNINARATVIIRQLQKLDTENVKGQKSVLFSRFKPMLAGFNLNPAHSLDTIITTPTECSIDRESGSATLKIPSLRPGVNFYLPWNYPMYRFRIQLGVLKDLTYGINGYTNINDDDPQKAALTTPWQYARALADSQTFTLNLQQKEYLTDDVTLLLSAGIEMGTPISDAVIERVKKTGSAKILKVA